ncbi:MAG: hypothetical protein U9R16_03875 [Campylobacterota bacterium]|nr:hypothetical protein [Campylobacterota bacterium]
MMKQAISLVEVLVSVMLISVVIVALLQIKENNLSLLEKLEETTKYNNYISMVALENNTKDGNIYLSEKLDFNDDDIRKELKDIKIEVKNQNLIPIKLDTDEYKIKINIKQTTLSMDDSIQKQYYRFKIED